METHTGRAVSRRAVLAGAAAGTAGVGLFGSAAATAAGRPGAFAVRGATVFDGMRSLGAGTVVVRGGRIAAVGSDVLTPAGVEVVDGRGKTVLPGLIDAHVHALDGLSSDAPRFGVTTELDMFSFYDLLGPYRDWRATTETAAVGDLWTAGILATAPGGHGTQYGRPIPTLPPEAGPVEIDEFVARRRAEGSDYIKIIMEDGSLYGGGGAPTLRPAQVEALIAAAHRHGAVSVVHVATSRDAEIAADLGADGLAHVSGDPLSDRGVEVLRSSGTFVITTLGVYNGMSRAGAAAELAADPRVGPLLTPKQRRELQPSPSRPYPEIYPAARDNVGRLHAAGVPVLAGTDAANPALTRGASVLAELTLLTEAGLSPMEALRAVTGEPARRFPIGHRGRIAVGHRADLVLVHGDATQDVSAVRGIDRVWRNGHPVQRQPASRDPRTPSPGRPRNSDIGAGVVDHRAR